MPRLLPSPSVRVQLLIQIIKSPLSLDLNVSNQPARKRRDLAYPTPFLWSLVG
jgi:hypothetical protein